MITKSTDKKVVLSNSLINSGDESNRFTELVKKIIKEEETTLYLAIYNSSNQRSYITVKLK